MKNHYRFIRENFLHGVDSYLGVICYDKNDKYYMSYPQKWSGLVEASYFGAAITLPVTAFYMPDQKHYHDISMINIAREAMAQYNKYVHDDGTADFRMTNFHDPAQTGFNVYEDFACVELISRFSTGTPEETALLAEMRDYLRRAGDAMVSLGFHTPNHRWVISSALATVYSQLHDKKYLDTMNRFFAEGIDCDENGEYTERSAGYYNNVCNQAFIEIAHQMNDDSFLEYPRRNLNLMMSFVEPDNTINSLNSTRMDNAQIHNYDKYWPYYLYMALAQKNEEFAYIADDMLDRVEAGKVSINFSFCHFIRWTLIHPELLETMQTLGTKKPEKDRSIYLPDSGIARIYNKENDMTVTLYRGHTPNFLKIQYKNHVIYGRFAGSFFGDPHSQFRPTVLEPTSDGFRLYSEEHAGYRSQLDEPQETSVWRRMDHSKRRWINIQDFIIEMFVSVKDETVTIGLSASGCETIPTKFEFSFDPGCRLSSGDISIDTHEGDYVFNSGNVKCMFPDLSAFEISGGYVSHYYANGMRGAVPVDTKRVTVAMTGETPHKNTVTVKLIRKNV